MNTDQIILDGMATLALWAAGALGVTVLAAGLVALVGARSDRG